MSQSVNPGTADLHSTIDVEVVREILGGMKVTYISGLGLRNQTLTTLSDQGSRISDLGPTMESAEKRIDALHKVIKDHDEAQDKRFEQIKEVIRGELKALVISNAKERIKSQIPVEVERRVKEQIGAQLVPHHLPKSIEAHVQDGRDQLSALETALKNSTARRENAAVTFSDTDRKLAVVYKDDGTVSGAWPNDLKALLAYDAERVKQLVKDFDLYDHNNPTVNLNRFLSHIGVVDVSVVTPIFGTPILASTGGR
ncbi:hypothetical protein C8Q79DRAFT_927686 [Trametes meyenii]|nr:hypothetical protein C8Q79DRAFT_927686 [Trametes meyenii]